MTGPMRHLARWHAAIDAGTYAAPTLTAVDGTGRPGSTNHPSGTPRRPYGRSSAATAAKETR